MKAPPTGLAPVSAGVTSRCLDDFGFGGVAGWAGLAPATPDLETGVILPSPPALDGATGVAPASPVWKTGALLLSYAPNQTKRPVPPARHATPRRGAAGSSKREARSSFFKPLPDFQTALDPPPLGRRIRFKTQRPRALPGAGSCRALVAPYVTSRPSRTLPPDFDRTFAANNMGPTFDRRNRTVLVRDSLTRIVRSGCGFWCPFHTPQPPLFEKVREIPLL